MESRAGGLVRLPGSVGGAMVEQSLAPNLTESAEPLDCHDGSSGVRVQSAGGSDGVDGLPDTWSERGAGLRMLVKIAIFVFGNTLPCII